MTIKYDENEFAKALNFAAVGHMRSFCKYLLKYNQWNLKQISSNIFQLIFNYNHILSAVLRRMSNSSNQVEWLVAHTHPHATNVGKGLFAVSIKQLVSIFRIPKEYWKFYWTVHIWVTAAQGVVRNFL